MPKLRTYPENVPGPFYVEADLCIQCRGPAAVSPNLIGGTGHHCHFKKQPETLLELEQAMLAVEACCCGAYRYAGNDPTVIARLGRETCDEDRS
jgi:hypothetical protein